MFFFLLLKISLFSKLLIFNFNNLIYLFNNLFLLINKLILLNFYYFYSLINIVWFLKKISISSTYLSRRFNLFYQSKFLNICNNYYRF